MPEHPIDLTPVFDAIISRASEVLGGPEVIAMLGETEYQRFRNILGGLWGKYCVRLLVDGDRSAIDDMVEDAVKQWRAQA